MSQRMIGHRWAAAPEQRGVEYWFPWHLEAGGQKPHARAAVRERRKAERKGNDARPRRSS